MDGYNDPSFRPYPVELAVDEVVAATLAEGTPEDKRTGGFLDENVGMRDPEGDALTVRVLEILAEAEERQRRRKPEDARNHYARTRAIVANGMRCLHHRLPPRVLYFRKADTKAYRDRPAWMNGEALANAVDAMAGVGLLEAVTGKHMPPWSKTESWAASYVVTDRLASLATECGVTHRSIRKRVPPERLVRLYEPRRGRTFDFEAGKLIRPARGGQILFENTEETLQWAKALNELNTFYDEQPIGIGLTPEQLAEWVDALNANPERRGGPYRLPEMIQTDLSRVFNNGIPEEPRFDQGGRLSGGWWQSVPSDLRKFITINGQPTVELDYSNCHPRMLYHEIGQEIDGDLYDLPEITAYEQANGRPPGEYRSSIKFAMQVLINSRGNLSQADVPPDIVFPPGYKLAAIADLLAKRHTPIAVSFKTGAGMRLMNRESDIAFEVVTTAMNEGAVALPIHDSFLTTTKYKDRLHQLMIQSYERHLRMEPSIRVH